MFKRSDLLQWEAPFQSVLIRWYKIKWKQCKEIPVKLHKNLALHDSNLRTNEFTAAIPAIREHLFPHNSCASVHFDYFSFKSCCRSCPSDFRARSFHGTWRLRRLPTTQERQRIELQHEIKASPRWSTRRIRFLGWHPCRRHPSHLLRRNLPRRSPRSRQQHRRHVLHRDRCVRRREEPQTEERAHRYLRLLLNRNERHPRPRSKQQFCQQAHAILVND